MDTIKTSKGKYITYQIYQDQYKVETQRQLQKLQTYCDQHIEKLQTQQYELQDDQNEWMRKQIIENINQHLNEHYKKIKEVLKLKGTRTEELTKTQIPKKETLTLKKLIIIPTENMEISRVTKIIREETQKSDE